MGIAIKDAIQDIAKTTITTGFFDKIKITATTKGTTIEALEKDKQVILKASTVKPVDGWEGEFGLANLALLNSITNDSEFGHKDSKLEMVYQQKGGVDVPSELLYTNKSDTFISYRFVDKSLIPEQPKYLEPKWDVVIVPTKSSIQQFQYAANSLGAYESYFYPRTVDGKLNFFIGDEGSANQRGGTVFATNVTGQFESAHKWPISLVNTILKLTDSADSEMSFSVKGAIQITLKTGNAVYNYIFPAKLK